MTINQWMLTLALATTSTITLADTLINNVTVISAERNKPLYNAYVHIIDDRIARVSSTPVKTAKSATVIDGSGKYLIPGLMDSHVHLSTMPGIIYENGELAENMAPLQQQFLQQQPKSYLYFGITQLLAPGLSTASRNDFNARQHKPDLFHCGAVPIRQGYPAMWASDETVHNHFEYMIVPGDPERTPERVVERMKADGANCVKVYIEDGFGSASHWPLISQTQLKRLRQAASRHGLPVFAHANAIDMQQIAIDADVDVLAHGMWNWNQLDGEQGIPEKIKTILDEIIDKGIVYQSTFNVMDGIKGVTVPGTLNNPLYAKVVTPDIMAWYQTAPAQWFAEVLIRGYDNLPLAQIHQRQDIAISQGERVTSYLYQNGHPMVLASDTPSSPTYAAQPGLSSFIELNHMAKIGISLADLLSAATLNNAQAYGLDADYGTVTEGKVANLLLLEKNPLTTIEAYNAIEKVILRGEVIERASLAAN